MRPTCMRITIAAIAMWMAIASVAAPAAAQQAAAPASNVVAAGVAVEVLKWTGVVTAVDHQARTVTLKGPKGNTRTFSVHKSVPGFDNLKPGDSVHADFVESVAIAVRKTSDPPVASAANVVTAAPKGGLPAVSDVSVKQVEANVLAVDQKTRMISLMSDRGTMWTFKVDPGVTAFGQIKKGNQVVVRFTDAVLITFSR